MSRVPLETEVALRLVIFAPENVAEEDPVPPLAIGNVPVTLVCKFAYVVEAEPVPPLAIGRVPVTLVCKLAYVVEVEPVPPEAIGNAEPRVNELK
jgi:hypothetical protein